MRHLRFISAPPIKWVDWVEIESIFIALARVS